MPVNNLIQLRRGDFTTWSSQDPVLASGEPGFDYTNNLLKIGDGVNTWLSLLPTTSSDLYVYAKNTTGGNLTKGQVVYINGALGDNPTITLAIASGEATSSKTLGLLKQNLLDNEFGYVVSEGILEGINTNSATTAGDPMWLSPTTPGGILYGLANKPSAPNHMVFLGYVLRKQQNNGKVYIKVQNGFELGELHNVATNGTSNGQFLQYNSTSGLWLASSSGNFTSLSLNGTGVSVSGHTHTSSLITDFNSSVSGLLPVKNILPGTGISISSNNGSFTINATSSGGGGGGIANLVEDTTPQLGGILDLNNYGISGVAFQTNPTGTIVGPNGWIYQSGQSVRSEGKFVTDGDAQYSQYILRNSTTNSSWTPLKNNGSDAILLSSNRTFSFSANIVGRATNTQANAAYKLEGLLFNDGYGASIVGTPVKTILGESDSSWDIRTSISGGGSGLSDYLLVEVSGSNSYNINWVGKVDLLEVGGNITNGYEVNILNYDDNFIP